MLCFMCMRVRSRVARLKLADVVKKGGELGGSDTVSVLRGRKPFAERVDVITARSQLIEALAKVRSKVDAEFGIRQWIWLDKDPNKLFDPCDDLHEGAISIALGRGSPPVFPIMRGRVCWLSSRTK